MRTLALAAALALTLSACFLPQSSRGNPLAPAAGTDPARAAELRNAGAAPRAVEETGLRPAPVDTTKRFEYVDLYVSMGDPAGQRQLMPYLIPQEGPTPWTIDKLEYVSDTLRHFRFRRLVSTEGKALPEVNPLAPRP